MDRLECPSSWSSSSSTSLYRIASAYDEAIFCAKAVGLGEAARACLPVPPGIALAGELTEAIAAGQDSVIGQVMEAVRFLTGPLAVRSSAVGEDGADASFAGQHLRLLKRPVRR
jgi:pyruvate,water dikinase